MSYRILAQSSQIWKKKITCMIIPIKRAPSKILFTLVYFNYHSIGWWKFGKK